MSQCRSILFAPGNQPRKAEKALASEADLVCLDLEDAVPHAEKAAARMAVGSLLGTSGRSFHVRINGMHSEHCFADLKAVAKPGLGGIVLPRYDGAVSLAMIDWVLSALEREAGLLDRSIEVMPTVETALGLIRLDEIGRHPPRVRRLSFGAWDYTLDTGIAYTPDEGDIAHARAQLVVHSRASGLAAPIDTSYPVIGDLPGLERSIRRAQSMGYGGKACIHPEQVEPANRLFMPSESEILEARAIVSAFEASEASGAAAVKVDGKFVDYPIYERAKRLLGKIR